MSGARYIATALALGGALVATTVLSSAPSEAKRAHFKKGHFVGSKAFRQQTGKTSRFSHKRTSSDPTEVPGKNPKDPNVGKLPPISSQPSPTKAPDVVKGPPHILAPQDGPTPFPRPTSSTETPYKFEPGSGIKPPKLPPVVGGSPLPPGTFDPGKLPPGGGPKLPPIVSGQPLPGPLDPGKLPPGGGPKLPPIVSGEPLPGPLDPGKKAPGGGGGGGSGQIPPVVIFVPSGGGDDTLPSGPKGGGIPVKAPESTERCDPCAWLKLSYDQTGLAKWLDRHRLCLTWQRGA